MLERIHRATGVQRRHLALPLETYAGMDGFGATNDAFIDVGVAPRRRGRLEGARRRRPQHLPTSTS